MTKHLLYCNPASFDIVSIPTNWAQQVKALLNKELISPHPKTVQNILSAINEPRPPQPKKARKL